ncbi:peptide chain release factor aRF-1 [Candidatus Pacearchaeota archaeon]|nr:peptide chain release factor aRF-1 [Candidatus Pacearchaeota archaeon]
MAKLNSDELAELLDILEGFKGRHTELITVMVPAGYDANAAQKQLEAEISTAKNIKSTGTRKNVTEALEKIIRYLKALNRTPENGLVLYCGNVSQVEGQDDMQLWDIEPPLPLKIRMYRCDKDFVTQPLREMLEVDEVFGLLVMDRKDATIGMLEGKRIEMIQKMSSGVPSKVRAGGQSSQRFHRITEGLTKEFYKRIADEMKKIFYDNPKLKGILIGGPIPTKDEFIDGEYLPTKLRELVIARSDLGYADEHGLKLLVESAQDVLSSQGIIKEKKILEKFFNVLGSNPKMAAYREPDVRKALEYGAVELLLLSKAIDKNLSKELRQLANNISAHFEIVSTETPEGEQFFNLSGIGAILRFSIN